MTEPVVAGKNKAAREPSTSPSGTLIELLRPQRSLNCDAPKRSSCHLPRWACQTACVMMPGPQVSRIFPHE